MDEIIPGDYKPLHLPMARIIYGVMGNTFGHVARTLALVRRLPEHAFHFVGGGRAAELLRGLYPVLEVPVKRTMHKRQQVSLPATVESIGRAMLATPKVQREIRYLIERWQPDLALSDREFFLPSAAQQAGLECVSIDHSHLLSACRYPVPLAQRVSWLLARAEDQLFFNHTQRNLIISFFHPPLKRPGNDELLPPLLRAELREFSQTAGDRILVYQTSPTFAALLQTVRDLPRPVVVYGFGPDAVSSGNVVCKPFDPRGLLEDLAACAYAVVNGGHNVICEALALGKPVLCFPIAGHFEQFLNARAVAECGFGDYCLDRQPSAATFAAFEKRLDEFRRNIARDFVDGSDQVVQRVREIIG